ncbi:MAG: hypothetical protein KAR05_03250 [Candidatus Omnitrophica bacterium]|nr:hypothetical protein [Candidatus Omnitrophota bacterium]
MKNLLKVVFCLFIYLALVFPICGAEEPKDIDAAIESITGAANNGNFQEVMSIVSTLIDQPGLSPSQRAQILYLRGWAHQKLSKEYSLAIADYFYAIELNAADKWTFSSLVNRSGCYLELKQYDKALEDVETALKIWPEHPVALNKKQLILSSMQSVYEGN